MDETWIKSAFYRPINSPGAAWDRLQREGPVGENVDVPVSWSESDLITFSHRDIRPRAYMGRLVVLSSDQGFEGQYNTPKRETKWQNRKNLPIPPQPSRFMICTDDDMFKRDSKIQTPKTESTDYSTSSSDESSVAKPVKAELSNDDPKHAKTPQKDLIIKLVACWTHGQRSRWFQST